MMSDIFSSFDPQELLFNSAGAGITTWTMSFFILLFFFSSFWVSSSRHSLLLSVFKSYMYNQITRTTGSTLTAFPLAITALFITLVLINLIGLVPYVFSQTAHLTISLSLALPLWMSLIISAVTKFPLSWLTHLLPAGAPAVLNSFLVLIETVSIMMRPLTLSIRLVANISAGHIVLGLLGIYAASAWFSSNLLILALLIAIHLFYMLFEFGVAMIQGYIFTLLLTLYSNDHPTQ